MFCLLGCSVSVDCRFCLQRTRDLSTCHLSPMWALPPLNCPAIAAATSCGHWKWDPSVLRVVPSPVIHCYCLTKLWLFSPFKTTPCSDLFLFLYFREAIYSDFIYFMFSGYWSFRLRCSLANRHSLILAPVVLVF